jgi:hypothetical protein
VLAVTFELRARGLCRQIRTFVEKLRACQTIID